MSLFQDKYQAMAPRDRKLLWTLIICSIAAGYMFWAAVTWEKMFDVQKMANRKADRIEKRLGNVEAPELEQGISEDNLRKLTQDSERQILALKQQAIRMMPLHDAGAREALKLEITQQAQSHMLRISRLTSSRSALRPDPRHLSGQALRDHFSNRPQFQIELGGHYLNLVSFLDALGQLQYQTYVTDLAVERLEDSNGYLKINLSLQL